MSEVGKAHGPNWLKHLGHLAGKPDVRGLEIGTFKGESAVWMCENIFTHPESRYVCVDPFTGNVEHAVGGIDCSRLEEEARAALAPFPAAHIAKGYSFDILPGYYCHGARFDFIYVDGSHYAGDVLYDSFLAFKLIKPGGILCWDDYEWEVFKEKLDRPKFAIDTFLEVWGCKLEVIHRGWQVMIRKTRE
jgi:predicted O-methyltransferase YrrM